MPKYFVMFIVLVFSIALSGCKEEVKSLSAHNDEKRVWVFAQFNVPEEGETEDSYWYFARIPQRLYREIANNRLTIGFIHLTQVRYWGDGDVIHEYRDGQNAGDLIFRIEDIRMMRRVVREPEVGLGYEQFEAEDGEASQDELKEKVSDAEREIAPVESQ